MGNVRRWGEYSEEAAIEDSEEIDRAGAGGLLKIKEGRNVFRFLPPLEGEKRAFHPVHNHFIKVPGQEAAASFNCPRLMAQRPCLACAHADKLMSTGNAADYKEGQKFLPKLRAFARVVDRNAPENGPQGVALPKTVYDALVKLRKDADAGGDFTHPDDGFDIIITRKGEGMDTKYTVAPARQASPLCEDEETLDAWFESMPNIERYTSVPDDDEILDKLGGAATAMGARPVGRRVQGSPERARLPSGGGAKPAPRPAAKASPAPRAAARPARPRTADDDLTEEAEEATGE